MKKLFILYSGISLFYLTACSSDTTENTLTEQPTSKVITYMPSFANYTTKKIQYYNVNNEIIADTTFDNTGAWIQRVVRTLNGNIKTTQTYNSSNTLTGTNTEEFDSNGRLINTTGEYNTVFTYNTNNTVTSSSSINGTIYFTFSKNPDGIINNRVDINNSNVSLNFQNQLPIEYLIDGNIAGNFTYYPNPMPSNLLKSVTDMNNTILRAYRLEHLPSSCNSYLKNWLWIYRYEREFDALNYQTHVKNIYIDTNVIPNTETITAESFYFYN
jgi:hypothetical protein